MPKRPKPKVHHGDKAERTKTGIKHKRTHLTPVQKILLGGGSLRNVKKRWAPE